MGQAVCEAVEGAADTELVGRADPSLGVELAEILPAADVVVDFTVPDTALAAELYGAERLSAACVGRDEDRFRTALAPVSASLVAA
ncbi:MAG TPA: hypothetical protein VF770_05305, partial [Solirubrobacterales bacterium]